jgi:hypothetical protein
MFEKGIHITKLMNYKILKKAMFTPTLRKTLGFLMKLRQTPLREKKEQTRRAKPKSCF